MNVTFVRNTATTEGGAFYSDNATPTLTNVIFNANHADRGGGMMNRNNSNATLIDVIFISNFARMVAACTTSPAAFCSRALPSVAMRRPVMAPEQLFLRGVEQVIPYTGNRDLVALTNQTVTQGCPENTACNPITRLIFGEQGAYRIETIQEVQTVVEFYRPLVARNGTEGE
jgi:predicted outer membrane repeat protein